MSDDPRFGQFITKGEDAEIVILGCPYDFYRKRTIGKGGEDNGPCCLRRFYPKVGPLVNPEFGIDISRLHVSDAGNICAEVSEEEKEKFKNVKTRKFKGEYVNYLEESPQKIIELISHKTSALLSRGQLPFLVGGSKQCIMSAADAFFGTKSHPNATLLLLAGKPFLKQPFDGDKGTSDNILTVLVQKFPNRKFHIFGAQLKYFPSKYIKFEGENKSVAKQQLPNVDWSLLEDIRAHATENKSLHRRTQALQKFQQIWPTSPTMVCISLEVISLFLGCRDASVVGLEYEEMLEIMMFLGRQANLAGVCVSEFNPSCEDFESSLKILNLLYYLLLGRACDAHV